MRVTAFPVHPGLSRAWRAPVRYADRRGRRPRSWCPGRWPRRAVPAHADHVGSVPRCRRPGWFQDAAGRWFAAPLLSAVRSPSWRRPAANRAPADRRRYVAQSRRMGRCPIECACGICRTCRCHRKGCRSASRLAPRLATAWCRRRHARFCRAAER